MSRGPGRCSCSLRCALRPSTLDEQTAIELLCGPLGGTDALGLRRLRRSLQLLADGAGDRSADLIAGALRDPRDLAGVSDRVAGPARRVAGLLAVATAAIADGGNAEDVLWAIWDASGLAEQWQRVSAAGGPAGAAADRDLDAVLALFDQAAHFTDTMPPGSPALFAESLSGQEIAGDTLAERAVREDCVRILTAHRSKGLEWEVVVVARRPGGNLAGPAAARITARRGGVAETVQAGLSEAGQPDLGADVDAAMLAAKLLAEERRLFYVAATRARRLLVVTAAGGEDTDQRPSRFLTELAGDDIPIQRVADAHGGHRWLSCRPWSPTCAGRPPTPAPRRTSARPRRPSWPSWPPRVRAAHPREWYALTERPTTADRGWRRDRPAVSVPGRVVHPVRAALAARGGRGRGGPMSCATWVPSSTPPPCWPRRAPPSRTWPTGSMRSGITWISAAPGTAPNSERWPSAWSASSSPGTPGTRANRRGGAGAQGPDRAGGDHRPGGPAGIR